LIKYGHSSKINQFEIEEIDDEDETSLRNFKDDEDENFQAKYFVE